MLATVLLPSRALAVQLLPENCKRLPEGEEEMLYSSILATWMTKNEDVSLEEFMYPVFIAWQVELS